MDIEQALKLQSNSETDELINILLFNGEYQEEYSTNIFYAWNIINYLINLLEEDPQTSVSGRHLYRFEGPLFKDKYHFVQTINGFYGLGEECWYIRMGLATADLVVAAPTAELAICRAGIIWGLHRGDELEFSFIEDV